METSQASPNASRERRIGAILIDSGDLTLENAERILRLQKEQGLRFGDAAVKLGLLTHEHIQFALARQFDYPYLMKGDGAVSDELIAAYQPFSPQVEALRALRSQLMLRWYADDEKHKALAIVSPGCKEGRSYLAANLAVVFSQLGEHTLLVDADMRAPRQHELFNLDNASGLSSVLSQRSEGNCIRRIHSFIDLSVLPAGPVPPNPQELLGRPTFAKLFEEITREFDIVIIDTPASAQYADAQIIAMRTGGALIVAHKHESLLKDLTDLNYNLKDLGIQVVGSVLSEF
ncbi:MAG TPA: chain length determinant protein tyrosine kinase EpsG [Rhodocyclaceae bacterium]|nr:chain length determinant protein tyrosine kinase EpsG [Rhodocyclaceae bacterium]